MPKLKVDGPWRRHEGAQALLGVIAASGYRALFVGGCVRNALLGEPVQDIDIATEAHPATVMELAGAIGFRPVPTGVDHGTVTVIADDGRPLEVTTFRKDVETDGRHAVVAFATDVRDDAARRDFTMNALYAEADGTIVDPLGGIDDALSRRLRFVGEPQDRIREDYLRILRYFRFHAWYGDPSEGLDAEAFAACAELADGLRHLSAERIGQEMLKLLAAPDPAPAVAAMAQGGILARILPGADPGLLAPLVHLEPLIGAAPEPIRRLAALGGEDAPSRLRLSRKQAGRLSTLRDGMADEAGLSETAWRHGAETARDIALLRAAAFSAPLPADLNERIEKGANATFPLSGADLAGRLDGPAIGRKLAELERRWIASDFTLGRDELLGS